MGFLDSLFGKKDSHDRKRQQETSPEKGNPVLIRAIQQQAVNPSPENLMRVHSALLASLLFIPVPEIPDWLSAGKPTTKGPVQLQVRGILDAHNVRTTPAFTDVEALRNWDPNTPYLGIKAVEFFRFLLGTDFQVLIINPFDPIRKMIRAGGRLTRAEIGILANGVVPHQMNEHSAEFRLKAQEKISITRPAKPPSTKIQELLRDTASSQSSIVELFYFQMATERGGTHNTIGIDLNGSIPTHQQNQITRSLGQAVRPELKAQELLDFTFVSGPFAPQMRNVGLSIYRKS